MTLNTINEYLGAIEYRGRLRRAYDVATANLEPIEFASFGPQLDTVIAEIDAEILNFRDRVLAPVTIVEANVSSPNYVDFNVTGWTVPNLQPLLTAQAVYPFTFGQVCIEEFKSPQLGLPFVPWNKEQEALRQQIAA